MATKKNPEEVTQETEQLENEQPKETKKAKTAEQPVDPWNETVKMVVPRKPRGEEQTYYICVNDRRFLLPANGTVQELPRPIAEVLEEALRADAEADDFADHIPNRSGEQPQEHAIGG